jgi:hypothetical protein
MTSQIFKYNIPSQILINLLNNIAIKKNDFYELNINSFKKGIYNQSIEYFINECKPYYYISKRKYLEKKLTYNSFITIIRQICNNNFINYTSKIKYDKSDYYIEYYIYINQ